MAIHRDDAELHRTLPAVRALGYFFLAIAAIMTAAAGWHMGGESTFASLVLAAGFAGITALVYYLLPYAVRFWEARARVVAVALGIFWAVAFGVEYYAHVAFSVSHRTDEIQLASFKTDTSAHTARAIAAAERRLERLEADRATMKPQQSAAEARAVMAKAEAHRWWTLTEKCTATKGPQTRQFCDGYRAAAADLEMWDALGRQEHTISEARAELASLQAERKGERPAVSMAAEQAKLMAVAFSGSLQPTQASVQWANISLGGLISLVFSLASAMCALVAAKWTMIAGSVAPVAVAAMAMPAPAPSTSLTVTQTGPGPSPDRIDAVLEAMRTAIHSSENKLLASQGRA